MKERIDRINRIIATLAWFGTLPLPDDSSESLVLIWEQALHIQGPIVSTFIPTFRNVSGSDGQISWPLQPDYFASVATADEIAKRYADGGATWFAVPFQGSGGLFTATEPEYHITVKGESKNAGLIAAFYRRNPERDFPGLADKLIRAALGL